MKAVYYLFHPIKLILYLSNKGFFNWLPDKVFLRTKYRLTIKKKLDLDNPRGFNEKLQWLKLYDKNASYVMMADKYLVKEYIANTIGNEYIIPTIAIYNSFDEIDFDSLPNEFVIKCTHDSGGIIIVKNKKEFNIANARKKINKYLKRNYFYLGREWPYKNIQRRIIIEKYMEDSNGELIDYKVMCFNGDPQMIFTCTDRYKNDDLKVTFFDLNWKKLPFERHYKSSNCIIDKPKNLKKMLRLSKTLSKDIPFVRVDWYEIQGKLYFGEFTFYPGSGFEEFTPDKWDNVIGDMLDLSVVDKYEK